MFSLAVGSDAIGCTEIADGQAIGKTHTSAGNRTTNDTAAAGTGRIVLMLYTVAITPVILQVLPGKWFITNSAVWNKCFFETIWMPRLVFAANILSNYRFFTADAEKTFPVPDLAKGSNKSFGNWFSTFMTTHCASPRIIFFLMIDAASARMRTYLSQAKTI